MQTSDPTPHGIANDAAEVDSAAPPAPAPTAPENEQPLQTSPDPCTPPATVDPALVEALLFSTHQLLTPNRLAELLEADSIRPIRQAVQSLNELYEQTGRSFRIEQVAGGFQMRTLPEYGPYLQKLHQREADGKLTRTALETLAIIAYKQPILRAEIESIRGVASGETIRGLMEKHLVKIAGRAEEPGRPILYGTTKRFLELFGLNGLKDLPKDEKKNIPAPPVATVEPSPLSAPTATAEASPRSAAAASAETSPAPLPSAPTSPPANCESSPAQVSNADAATPPADLPADITDEDTAPD